MARLIVVLTAVGLLAGQEPHVAAFSDGSPPARRRPPPVPARFDSKDQSVALPFDRHDDLIFTRVRVNQSEPLWFVVDSGASRILIDRRRAQSLGLRPEGASSVQGAGAGRVPVEMVRGVSLSLPGLTLSDHDIWSIDLAGVTSTLGRDVDGILGYDFFARLVITVDYTARSLTIVGPERYRDDGKGATLPIEFDDKLPYVRGELVLPGEVTIQDRFLVDSGSSDAVDHPAVKHIPSRSETTTGVGLGTAGRGYLARGKAFRLAGFEVSDPIVACCGGTEKTSKLIGGAILSHFRVTFDYANSRLIIAPGQNAKRTRQP
jgi:hypothetical protein